MERQDEQFDIRDYKPTGKERDFENALRPLQFEDFSGQDKVVDNLRIFVKAARLHFSYYHAAYYAVYPLGQLNRSHFKTEIQNVLLHKSHTDHKIQRKRRLTH